MSQTTKEKCAHFKQVIENLKTKFRELYTLSNTDLTEKDVEFDNCVDTHNKYYALSTFIDDELPKLKQEIIDNLKFSHEQYLTEIHPFMMETYRDTWGYTPEQLETVESNAKNPDSVHITHEIPYDELREENESPDPSRAGAIYLSPEQPIDFEHAKVFFPPIPPEIASQGVSGVMKYIYETYKDTHIIPDIKYWKYITELGEKHRAEKDPIKQKAILDKIPKALKDTTLWFFFTGSALAHKSGFWYCPCAGRRGGDFDRIVLRLDNAWGSAYRVVLLEK